MAFIGLGKLDKSLIPIGIGFVFSFLSRLLFNYNNTILYKHSLISNLFLSLVKLLTIIPLIIFKVRSKSIKNIDKEKNRINNMNLTFYKDSKQKIILCKYLYIVLNSAIFVIQGVVLFYTVKIKTNFWIFESVMILVFYYLIFRIKLYRHHYLSIGLIILTGLIIDLAIGNLQNDFHYNLILFALRCARETLYSLHDVINKYIMERKYGSVYEICFYNGLFCSILIGVFYPINYYLWHLDDFSEYFDNFNKKELLVLLGFMSTQLGLYLFCLITNRDHSPCHIFIIYAFGQLAYYIDIDISQIAIIIGHIFILFMSLIFNEIIEINFCGLSKNTKKNIMMRANDEDKNGERILTTEEIEIDDDVIIELKDKSEQQE